MTLAVNDPDSLQPAVAVDVAVLTVPPREEPSTLSGTPEPDGLGVVVHRRESGEWALPGTFLHEGERLTALPDDVAIRPLDDAHPGPGASSLGDLEFDHQEIVTEAVRELRAVDIPPGRSGAGFTRLTGGRGAASRGRWLQASIRIRRVRRSSHFFRTAM